MDTNKNLHTNHWDYYDEMKMKPITLDVTTSSLHQDYEVLHIENGNSIVLIIINGIFKWYAHH